MAKASAGTLRIDFSKEEASGGGRIRLPEDDYHVKILSAKSTRSPEKDTPGLEVTFQVIEGKKKGKKITDTLWITPKSLKRVRLLLEAVGVKVPKSAVNIPLNKLKGKTLWIELEDEAREGYDTRSRVAFEGFMNEDDYDEMEDDDEDLDDEDDEDDDEEDDDEDEDDEDDDEEDDEDDEDEDDEEDEPPVKKRRARSSRRAPAKKAPAKKASTRKKRKPAADDDEIEDLDLDDL